MSHTIGFVVLACGGATAFLNFYRSVLRYLLYRVLGRADKYRFVSGLPALGTLFLIIAAVLLFDVPVWRWLVAAFIVIDTGGLPWFCGVMLWQWFFNRQLDREK